MEKVVLKVKGIKDSDGKKYTIKEVTCEHAYGDDDFFSNINIYLSGYNADDTFLYNDPKIEDGIQQHASPLFYAGFSEMGLQGDNYINYDLGYSS